MINQETCEISSQTRLWSATSDEHLYLARITYSISIPAQCIEKSLIAAETSAKTILTILGVTYDELKNKYSHKPKTFRDLTKSETGKGNPYAKVMPLEVRAAIAFFADAPGDETYAISRYPTPAGTPGERASGLEWQEFYHRAITLCKWKDKIVKGFMANGFIV